MIDGKNMRQNLERFLDPNEQGYIEQFYNNEKMREAVKKVLLATIYENGVIEKGKEFDSTRNAAFSIVAASDDISDEKAGKALKVLWEGVRSVEAAFNAMSVFKIDEPKGENINDAK